MSNTSDIRIGSLLRTDVAAAKACDIVIVGVPTDEGVRRNGGRVGAAQAPDEIRKYLKRLTPFSGDDRSRDLSTTNIFDHRNIIGSSLEEIHQQAQHIVADYTSRGCFVISLGGGHDVSYPVVSGVHQGSKKELGLINIDAHLDVRPRKGGLHHSGSSFRLLIEDNVIVPTRFVEFGIQAFSVSKEHCDWTTDQGASIIYYDTIRKQGLEASFDEALSQVGDFYLSFDIDAIRSSDAPGSSAPSPIGFSADEALQICSLAAASGKLIGLDIVEVNPLFDLDSRTSRLAGRMILTCLSALP